MKVDFFIVGTPKAGTTSLYHYLNNHPEISMSIRKETNFFSYAAIEKQKMYGMQDRINTIEKYHSLFTDNKSKILGEASVSYLFYRDVPEKIRSYNQDAKIIIMLRNPIDRAFSHYLMDLRLGFVNNDFDEIIEKGKIDKSLNLFYQQYVEVGLYYKQVKRYLDTFGNKNTLIIFHQDFKRDLESVLFRVYQFLNINKNFKNKIRAKHNAYIMPKSTILKKIYSIAVFRKIINKFIPKGVVKKIGVLFFEKVKKPKLSDSTKNMLLKIYNEDILLLENLLSEDLSRWKR